MNVKHIFYILIVNIKKKEEIIMSVGDIARYGMKLVHDFPELGTRFMNIARRMQGISLNSLRQVTNTIDEVLTGCRPLGKAIADARPEDIFFMRGNTFAKIRGGVDMILTELGQQGSTALRSTPGAQRMAYVSRNGTATEFTFKEFLDYLGDALGSVVH